jgi:thymidylate kinase
MNIILMGCEYVGKSTLAKAIGEWIIEKTGMPYVRWHDHFVLPQIDNHLVIRRGNDESIVVPGENKDPITEVEEEELLSLSPVLREQFHRYLIWRHLHPDVLLEEDYLLINFYYADAVYATLYYGFGEAGSFSDRRVRARAWDRELLKLAPDTLLVLVKASPEVVVSRMKENPRPRCILKEEDVPEVLNHFEEEFNDSLIRNRIVLDTTGNSPSETFIDFSQQIESKLTPKDHNRLVTG